MLWGVAREPRGGIYTKKTALIYNGWCSGKVPWANGLIPLKPRAPIRADSSSTYITQPFFLFGHFEHVLIDSKQPNKVASFLHLTFAFPQSTTYE